jgi:hypothetical protein
MCQIPAPRFPCDCSLAANEAACITGAIPMTAIEDEEANFTQRVLMSLVVDVHYLCENADRIRVQTEALARENGVAIPKWDD